MRPSPLQKRSQARNAVADHHNTPQLLCFSPVVKRPLFLFPQRVTQVLARRHSCLTTTFYLLKNELSTTGSGVVRPSSAVTPSSAVAKPTGTTIRPSSAGRIGRHVGDSGSGAASAKPRTGGGGSANRSASQSSRSRSQQRALAA